MPAIKQKLDVLREHCTAVGRDPADITKTSLGGLVIGATTAEAERKGEEYRRTRGLDEERYRSMVTAGDPDTVAERARAYFDAGLDGLLFNMPDAYDLESVALAGKALTAAL